MHREEVFDFLSKSEKNAYEYCIKELKSVFASSAPQSLLRKFNTSFKKDDQGKLREWREIEEAKIKELFEENKKNVDTVMEQFKRVYFPTGITKMEEIKRQQTNDSRNTVTMEDLMEQDPIADGGEGDFAGGLRRSRTSISISSIRILTEEEIGRVKTKFHEEIEQVFVEAIRAHVSHYYLYLC